MKLFDLVRPLAAVAALCAPLSAHAGRPMAADDAVILDEGACQLETAFISQAWYALPTCRAGAWELGAGVLRQSGHDSLLLQAKTLLRPLHSDGWGAALVLTGAQGADRAAAINLPLTVSLWRDALLVHANLGAQRQFGAAGYAAPTWALGAELALGARSAVTLERYGSGGGHDRRERHVRLGARYSVLPDRLDLDASVSRDEFAAGTAPTFALGMTLTGWSLR